MNFFSSLAESLSSVGRCRHLGRPLCAGLLFVLVCTSAVHAQPTGANIVAGTATITSEHGTTTVTASNNSVLQWSSFNVAPTQTVQFVQPSTDSRVLNWIGGLAPSQIDGTIRANGQVYLINPAGVYFGQTAVIDAARIYAVAGSLSKEDFFAGNDRFTNLVGDVRNEGSLRGSTVALIGRTVANTGTIVSPDGFVAMAAGDQVFLGRKGSSIFVDTGAKSPSAAPAVSSTPGVTNTGTIDAGEGTVALAAGDLYSVAISHTGQLRGREVRVQGQGRGDVLIDGSIDATGRAHGQKGGSVEVTGDRVGLLAHAAIDASGTEGGGTILVGGDAHGANPEVRNAQFSSVLKGAVLKADATENGQGGKAVVWSDHTTFFEGEINARGGRAGGAGGFAEVSGAYLTFRGTANLGAPHGAAGKLLLDPLNLTIDNGADNNVVSTVGLPPIIFNPTASPSTLSWATILGILANSDVEIDTSTSTGPEAGNITIAASPLGAYNSSHALTFNSAQGGNITVSAPVISSGTGGLTLNSGGGIILQGAPGATILGTNGTLSLFAQGSLTGPGVLTSASLINLGASLGIGTLVAPIVTSTPGLSIQGSGTSAHVANSLDQGFIFTYSGGLTGQLELISKNNAGLVDRPISLLLNGSFIPDLRVVGSDIQFSSLFSAGLLTVANSGTLILPSNTFADTLVFESSGNVGTALAPLLTGAGVLTFNKTGGNAYINVNGQNSFTVISGSSTNTLIDLSVNSQGQPSDAIIDTSSLTATNVSINAVAITLNGSINSSTTTLNHSGNLSGNGILSSTTQLNLNGSGAVGAVDPVLTQTPSIVLTKTAPAPVSIINSNNAGLTLGGSGSGTTSVTAVDSTLQASSPITIAASGLVAAGGLTLSSSTLNLAGGITSPSIALDHSGLLSGPGTLNASQAINLNGAGNVGTAANPIITSTSLVDINKPAGSVFIDNGLNDLAIGFAVFTGAGSFHGGNVSTFDEANLTNVGNNPLTFTSSQTLTVTQQIVAGTLTLINDGALQFSFAPRATTLVLGGAGDVGNVNNHFSTSADNLVLQKTGTAQVFVDNGLDAGLNVSGSTNGTLAISSLNTARTTAAGLTTAGGGLSSATSTTLTSSTVALGSPITSPLLTLNASGAITGSGTLTASTQLALNGVGNVGTGGALIATTTPSLVLNKPAGAVFLNNGNSALTLTPTAFTGGGALRSGDFTLAGPIDVGLNNDLSFTATGSVTLGANAIRANTLTLAHDGALSVSSTGALTINTLALGGAGDDGTAANPFVVDVGNLILAKTGAANAYLSNRRDLGLTLSGSANGNIGLTSLGLSGLNPAPLTIAPAGLTSGSSIALTASTLALGGNLTGPDISLNNSAGLSGPGGVTATTQVTFAGSGSVGTNFAPITTNTLSIALNKPAGAVYVNNGASGLSLTPIVFTGGGAFRSGSISLAAPLDVGTNPLDLTATTGALSFGTRSLTGGLVNLTSAGGMTGSGLLSATQLALAGAGDVSFSSTRVPAVVLNKPTGAVVLNNGTTNLSLTPTVFTGGGSFTGGNVSLLGPVNVGTNNLTLASSGILDLGSFAIQADTLTLAHDGVLANYAAPNVTTLNLGGTGDDGTASAFFTLATSNLVLSKTGAASVYLENRRDLGVALSGTTTGLASIRSLNTAGTAAAGLTVGSSGLTTGGLLTLNSSTLALGGNLTGPDISLNHSAALSGAGTVAAATQVTFAGSGSVGTNLAPITTNTLSIALNKPAGAVYVNNGAAGLSLSPIVFTGGGAFRSGSISLAAPLDVGTNPLDLTATTGGLSLGTRTLTGGLVNLSSAGSTTGSGLVSATRLTLGGAGDVSLSNTRVPAVVLNKATGAVGLNNGTTDLTLTPTVFTGGGSFTGGNVSLLGPVNVGTNVLTLASSGVLDLGGFAVQADTLTLAHDGALANYAAPNVTTLNLGGSGDDGSATAFFTLATDNLVLSKTGAANVYLENRRDPGVTLSGTTNGIASIRSLNTTGSSAAGLTVGANGLTAGGSLTLSSSTLALSGLLTSPTVTVTNTGLLNGSGAIRASTLLTLNGIGDVGTSSASIATTTPAVTTNKSAGAVFLNNGNADLALTSTALAAGGAFSAGNLTLLSSIAAGTNAITLSSSGTLNLGANALTGGAITLTNGGALTGSGTITAAQLSLGGAGAVGTAGAPLSSRIPLLTVNKTTGAVYLDNGPLDLSFSATGFLGGGVLRGANLSLVGPVNAGGSSVSFITTGNIDFKGNAVTADLLNLSHNGSLLNLGSLTVNTLGLGGSGDDGTAATPFALSVPNLLLSKTGSANVFLENKRDLGLTVAGFANAALSITSRNSAGTAAAPLAIGSGGLTTNGSPAALAASRVADEPVGRRESDQLEQATPAQARRAEAIAAAADSSIVLNVGDLVLTGGIDTATLTINNSGGLTGPGLLHATVQLNLGSTGDVGSAPSPIMANTPLIALNKSAGQVFINNNGMPLSLNPIAFIGGGSFESGSFTLLGTISVGTNDFTVTTTGDISLGSNPITGGKITFNNGGLLSGTALAVITGSSLVLDRNGNVGAAGAPLVFSGPTTNVELRGSKAFVNISFSGGVQAELPIESKAVVATETHLAAAILEEERGVLPEADSASTPGRESRRGSGAAFRAIAAKADLASAAREQLQALGVYARPLRLEERLSRERKQAVFVTLPERERPNESDFEVVDARIDPAALREVLRLASETGLTQTDKNRLEPVAKSLNATFTAFSAAFPTGEAAAFRSWLETRGDADSAIVLNFVKSLRSTIQKIELLGLTHQEIEVSKTQIFGSILRTQLNADPDFLRSLVETAPRPNSTATFSSAAGEPRIAAR